MSMLNFSIGWRKRGANRIDVRVVLRTDEAGRRCVEVGTALSLPRRFEYMTARKYRRVLWGEKP